MHRPIKSQNSRSSSRIKTTAEPAVITRDEAERIVGQITELTIKRTQLLAEVDEQISAIRSKYESTIGNLEARIETLTTKTRDWAVANPAEFGKRKSIEFSQGVIGFRTGTPKLKTLSGWTFARCLHVVMSLSGLRSFVRVKEELDKEGLIAAYAAKSLSDSELQAIGLRVDQDETFFVDPAVTDNEPRQQVAAKEAA